ncbi:MAG: sulfite exporter TauE/SafE family protein, partial [Priestia megaterium]
MDVSIVLTMLAVGLILGFVGAGGSGFIISILTLLYGVSVHVALATALTAMIFSSLSGAVSHYREGNVSLKSGISVGILGALGAWIGSNLSSFIPEGELKWLTAGMLLLSGVLLWLR